MIHEQFFSRSQYSALYIQIDMVIVAWDFCYSFNVIIPPGQQYGHWISLSLRSLLPSS